MRARSWMSGLVVVVGGVLATQVLAVSPATGTTREPVAPVVGQVARQAPSSAGRADDGAPFYGGARYISTLSNDIDRNVGKSGSTCTAGFAWRKGSNTYLVTAGHCFPRGTKQRWSWTFRTSGGKAYLHNRVGATVGTTVGPQGTVKVNGKLLGDIAMIKARSAARLYTGGPSGTANIAVTGQAKSLPRKGDSFCVSGATTGTHCGWKVSATNLRIRESGALIVGLTEGKKTGGGCIKKGDSGGAVYATSKGKAVAQGIVSGYAGKGCTIFFTPIQSASRAFGGSVAH